MSKFTLESFVTGKRVVDKLIVNGECQIDDFFNELNGDKRNQKKAASLYAAIEYYANGNTPPNSKFKILSKNKGEVVNEYEFKKDDVRIYCIKKPNGAILILGGFRKRQKRDLNKFHAIKKQYLESLNDGL